MARKNPNPFGGGRDDEDAQRQGGQMVPFGGMLPILIRENSNQQVQHVHHNDVFRHSEAPPVRAQMALEFLKVLKLMEAQRPVIYGENGSELKVLEGQKLTPDESAAQAAAAGLLTAYFNGNNNLNPWEKADLILAPTASITCLCVDPDTKSAQNNCPLCYGRGTMTVVLDPTKIQQQPITGEVETAPTGKAKR